MYFLTFCDAARPLQFGFQDSGTVAAEGMVGFHDYLLLMLIFIGAIIFELLRHSLVTFSKNSSNSKRDTLTITHSSYLEIIWTVIPAYALLLIAVPSFTLLYSLDDLIDASLVIRITGHQWYWTYEYTKYTFPNTEYSFTFDSYMKNTSDLKLGQLRLLEVDNRVLLPTKTHIRLLVTADDVLHSWAVPSFGIKVDACPGRVSQASLYIKRSGHYYGQCSEICGFNHGFMPIVIRGVNKGMYILWYIERLHFFLGPDVLKTWSLSRYDLILYKNSMNIYKFLPSINLN